MDVHDAATGGGGAGAATLAAGTAVAEGKGSS
jgi:hypothetical protein